MAARRKKRTAKRAAPKRTRATRKAKAKRKPAAAKREKNASRKKVAKKKTAARKTAPKKRAPKKTVARKRAAKKVAAKPVARKVAAAAKPRASAPRKATPAFPAPVITAAPAAAPLAPRVLFVRTPAQTAQAILDSRRIKLATRHPSGVEDQATARQNLVDTAAGQPARRSAYGNAPGGTVRLSARLLDAILALAADFEFGVSEIAGASHSKISRHYAGVAFDVNVLNGAPVNAANPHVPRFMAALRNLGAEEVLGPGHGGHASHVHGAWPRV